MATFLQLPPEQGGLRFGPFNGIVQIGSDPRRCQITLDAGQGIYPMHATLVEAGGGLYHFAPVEMGAKAFVVQQGSPQVWPVQAAVQVKSGDSIIVGTPAGPRFQVIGGPPGMASQGPGPAMAGVGAGGMLGALGSMMSGPQRHPSRQQTSFGQGIADEFARRGRARMMTQSPFREIAMLQTRLRSGNLFNPVTIVGVLFTIAGMLSAGAFSCSGLAYSLWRQLTH